MPSAVICVSF